MENNLQELPMGIPNTMTNEEFMLQSKKDLQENKFRPKYHPLGCCWKKIFINHYTSIEEKTLRTNKIMKKILQKMNQVSKKY